MKIQDKTLILSFDIWNQASCEKFKNIILGFNRTQWSEKTLNQTIAELRTRSSKSIDKKFAIYISLDYIMAMTDDDYRSDAYIGTDLPSLKKNVKKIWGELFKNYHVIGTGAGSCFTTVSKEAHETATETKNAIFNFNGIDCIVSPDTDLELLLRDYRNASYLKWDTVGPNCATEYDTETAEKLRLAIEKSESDLAEMQDVWAKEAEDKQNEINAMIAGVILDLKNETLWNEYKEKNTDPYGGRCVSYADEWGRLMQAKVVEYINECISTEVEPDIQNKIAEIANDTSHIADYDGISGFMYGAAVSMLSNCWVYGEELRKWHNKEYSYEGAGVVNPAVLTLNVPS